MHVWALRSVLCAHVAGRLASSTMAPHAALICLLPDRRCLDGLSSGSGLHSGVRLGYKLSVVPHRHPQRLVQTRGVSMSAGLFVRPFCVGASGHASMCAGVLTTRLGHTHTCRGAMPCAHIMG